MIALALASAALAPVRSPLLRCPAAAALVGDTHTALAQAVLQDPAWLARLETHEGAAQLHYWSDDELSELQWPPLAAAARRQRAEWAALAAPPGVPAERFGAALALAHRHGLVCDGQLWLVPGTTVYARSAPRGAALERCGSSGDLLLVGAPDADGEAATICSGWRSNDELLLAEGWADGALECDAFALPEAVAREAACDALGPGGAALREKRDAVVAGLRAYNYLPEGSAGEVYAGGLVSDELGRYLQALALEEDELAEYQQGGCVILIGEGTPLSVSHERRVGEVLARACELVLGGFATAAPADEALLETGLAARHREAVRSRLSRKRCLAAVLERARAWVERPTAAGGTLRRPWRVHVRTSG